MISTPSNNRGSSGGKKLANKPPMKRHTVIYDLNHQVPLIDNYDMAIHKINGEHLA